VNYERISQLTEVQIIAKGNGLDIRHHLNRTFGYGNWRKLKGNAVIRYESGEVWLVELHWYEAQGIGKRLEKVKHRLEQL
jgi:hypothetical protein